MAITLDHTIVPSLDQDAGAGFFARMFGLESTRVGHFTAVRINDSLTLDFSTADGVRSQHYAFLVDDDEFDEILARVQAEALGYGSSPFSADDSRINTRRGGRGVYFRGGPDPHLWEIMTRPETGS